MTRRGSPFGDASLRREMSLTVQGTGLPEIILIIIIPFTIKVQNSK